VNRLADESSPYLRQHRDNPVDWYPWGVEALEQARREDRPILLSVGYSACHWCHVMAHECFEDDEVADVMNELFVNVKVDREERPDVDALYMDAVQAMTGRGGWPMTVFLTPGGEPFFGGTYYPKEQFVQLLRAVDDVWRNRRSDLSQNVDALRSALDRSDRVEPAADLPDVDQWNAALSNLGRQFDAEWGGFGTAPKFPSTMQLELLLQAHLGNGDATALRMVTTSLDAMASGGIYDHLGGGFARYSVDDRWLVPHFEKMLYDQALLGRIYLHAWQVTGEERYLQVVRETVGYVRRDLGHLDGGWYSAEDADSPDPDGHGAEGAFYVWTAAEVRAAIAPQLAEAAIEWYGITELGNFEGRTILSRLAHRGDLVRPPVVEAARAALAAARSGRPRPGLDDKVVTEWNALMLGTLAEAAAATGEPSWLDAARRTAAWMCETLRDEQGRWYRTWHRHGGRGHVALAADLAALVDGFTRLGEATGEARWIAEAVAVADDLLARFWDPSHGGLYTVADDAPQLIARQKDLFDNATPSANALAAHALVRLAALTGERRYEQQADQILRLVATLVAASPTGFAHSLLAAALRRAGVVEVVITGDRPDLLAAARSRYLPRAVLAWGEPYDSPLWEARANGLAYVCQDFTCAAPQSDAAGLLAQLV
jgi:uncharacterized protein